MKSKQEIISGVKEWSKWWIVQRRKKLEDQLNGTMSINPFMMPFLFDYHDLSSFEELADLVIASHLMTGHNTGFGKLVDEKILPNVFGAQKLDSKFRAQNPPFSESCFDEIDHIITRENGQKELLSLKAGKWTIQLTMAVQLNVAFREIIENHPEVSDNIAVGVFYGKKDGLTDKYDILRGVNRGANHNVFDLTSHVHVYAGRDFWTWLSGGAIETQEWVLKGILEALEEEKIHETASTLLEAFKVGVVDKYENDVRVNGKIDWMKLLKKING
ncbi:PmeII family type II restriction endonuclease [Pseudomonas sp. sp1636]|uniref:PmeII family type II restriction endonuclease n=1 Tax=Pseudomonas sp. sp1636 TaxID=3036707 RepID=UPI0025A5CEDA|nr:PmeII family type II restriction endonuclease [Pseudomonas sp. sp1636]MDM8350777.1 PmeII family type II restriction endonuclease [Pseudomonas sp. sp1636]